jgi:hypothetical protein
MCGLLAFEFLIFMPMAALKVTRAYGALGLMAVGWGLASSAWCFCAVYTKMQMGWGFFIAGLLSAIGMFPLSMLRALIYADWQFLGSMTLQVIAIGLAFAVFFSAGEEV